MPTTPTTPVAFHQHFLAGNYNFSKTLLLHCTIGVLHKSFAFITGYIRKKMANKNIPL